jgi:hypothetical protein
MRMRTIKEEGKERKRENNKLEQRKGMKVRRKVQSL